MIQLAHATVLVYEPEHLFNHRCAGAKVKHLALFSPQTHVEFSARWCCDSNAHIHHELKLRHKNLAEVP